MNYKYLLFGIIFLLSTSLVTAALTDNLTTDLALNEPTKTVATNLQSPYLNGTVQGTPTQNVTGKLGTAYLGWTAANYVDLNFATPTTSNFSFNIWVNWTNSSDAEMFMIGGDSNAQRSWGLYMYKKQIILGCVVDACGGISSSWAGGGYALENTTRDNIAPNSWIMITGTYNTNKSWTLYVNGAKLASQTQAPTSAIPTSPNLNLGRRQYTGVESVYNSGIDQFNWWTGKILNQSDITSLYNGGVGLAYPLNITGTPTYTIQGKCTYNTTNINNATIVLINPDTNAVYGSTTSNSTGDYNFKSGTYGLITNNTLWMVTAYFRNTTIYYAKNIWVNVTVAD